ncbi:hypothetical protein ACIA8K_30100 [Catenuloplanes sp. NPDC051500]|uniref:hypothetical protein n=1 Tax=Catenuloplanes sp. NPDC051500 TaxID=3363959 RepID=UPI003787B904
MTSIAGSREAATTSGSGNRAASDRSASSIRTWKQIRSAGGSAQANFTTNRPSTTAVAAPLGFGGRIECAWLDRVAGRFRGHRAQHCP